MSNRQSRIALRVTTSLPLAVILFCIVMQCRTRAATPERQSRPSEAIHGKFLPRFPDVSATQIIFVSGGHLWLVPRAGGEAAEVKGSPMLCMTPKFSPDGNSVAFSANVDGHWNLHSILLTGGEPNRLSYLPADEKLCQWTSAGKLLFETDGLGPPLWMQKRLFTLSAEDGLPAKLPVPFGTDGAISADGKWLAYTPHPPPDAWKGYRGGGAPDIWLFNLETHAAQQITDWKGIDSNPMWHGHHVYYLSDAGPEGRLNIWSYDTSDHSRRQLTTFGDYDIRHPSLGPGPSGGGEIVFVNGTDLYLLDLAGGAPRRVDIHLPFGKSTPRPHVVDAGKHVANWSFSPDGNRVVAEARGDLWIIPVGGTKLINLTRTSGIAERDPAWSPDGRWIAYVSDASGEYELWLMPADGGGGTHRLTTHEPPWRFRPIWSPDSHYITLTDDYGTIELYDLKTGQSRRIVTNPLGTPAQPSWSPDSSWIAYCKGLGKNNPFTSIWLYDVKSGVEHHVTSGQFNDSSPVFDDVGNYLFFVSDRDFSWPVYDRLDGNAVFPRADMVLAVPLRKDVPLLAAPTANRNAVSLGGDSEARPAATRTSRKTRGTVAIDLDGFERRAVQVLAQRAFYWNLAFAGGKLLVTRVPLEGEPSIEVLDLGASRFEPHTVTSGLYGFSVSGDGKKLVARRGAKLVMLQPVSGAKEVTIDLNGMTVEINQRQEWRQIFSDAWRFYRDDFYAANMNGVDWPAMRARYEKLLDACLSRDEVNYVISELLGELHTSHVMIVNPGDVQRPDSIQFGMTGVDFTRENDAYRISKLYEGAAWDADARNPLREAGVREGDFLLAVNGVPIHGLRDPWQAFRGMSTGTVTLTVSQKPKEDADARKVMVTPLDVEGEKYLRYRAWVEENRASVQRLSGGKIGYVDVPYTNDQGTKELARQFYGQCNTQALVVDDRWNGGGRGPDRLIELLSRRAYFKNFVRRGLDWRYPAQSHEGPKCMLINGASISGGDNFAYQFRKAHLGKLIGMTTAGGLLGGRFGSPWFVDGGNIMIPTLAPYAENGSWVVEGVGVKPDIEIPEDPSKMLNGQDPQIAAAVTELLKELEQPGAQRSWLRPAQRESSSH